MLMIAGFALVDNADCTWIAATIMRPPKVAARPRMILGRIVENQFDMVSGVRQ